MKKNEHTYYDQPDLWKQNNLEPYQQNVLSDITHHLPKDISTILDVGCGDGYITNVLAQSLEVVGLDWSCEALKKISYKPIAGSVEYLPFKNESFDLVMANDVIEHIPTEGYQKALGEIARVAKHYVLLTVPFQEILNNQNTLCLKCGCEYHINLHKRSYSLSTMRTLYGKEWKIHKIIFSGEERSNEYLANELIRKKLELLRYWEVSLCPTCGQQNSCDFGESEIAFSLNQKKILSLLLSKFCNRNECIVLLSKKNVRKNSGISFKLFEEVNAKQIPCDLLIEKGKPFFNLNHVPGKYQTITIQAVREGIKYVLPRVNVENNRALIPQWFILEMLGENTHPEFHLENERSADSLLSHLFTLFMESQNKEDKHDFKFQELKLAQQSIDLENARAELDALKLRLGQTEQQAVDLQNARAEMDALKLRLGQTEQQAIDLQNARAELDALKLKLGQAEQQAIDLQNVRAELELLKYNAVKK